MVSVCKPLMKGRFPKSASNGCGQREVAFAFNPNNELRILSEVRKVNERKLLDRVSFFVISAALDVCKN